MNIQISEEQLFQLFHKAAKWENFSPVEEWSNLTVTDAKNKAFKRIIDQFFDKEVDAFGFPSSYSRLKQLWDEWHHPSIFSTFEMFIWCHYMEVERATFITDTDKQVHKWLAQHCGFLTTAEVKHAIQELKNF